MDIKLQVYNVHVYMIQTNADFIFQKLIVFLYCKRTYYRGVIFTRICIFGLVRGYEIPRNRPTLNT